MKIAMIGHKRIPSREGGVEIVVEKLAERMVAQGHEVYAYNRKGHHVVLLLTYNHLFLFKFIITCLTSGNNDFRRFYYILHCFCIIMACSFLRSLLMYWINTSSLQQNYRLHMCR